MLFKIRPESLNGHLCLSVGSTTLGAGSEDRGNLIRKEEGPHLQMGKEDVVDNWGTQISVLKFLNCLSDVGPLFVCSLVLLFQTTLQVRYFLSLFH